jgi:hypothetical protein
LHRVLGILTIAENAAGNPKHLHIMPEDELIEGFPAALCSQRYESEIHQDIEITWRIGFRRK